MQPSIHLKQLTLGVCYYPEQWPESMWRDDLRRMKAAGISVVRVFEFAWSVVEPRDNEWDFSLTDAFLALAQEEGMKVIIGTPTATPPAWLTHAHPETLNVSREGVRMNHGHRRHYSYNVPVYQHYCARVVTALAERYGQHPAVIGWQIDNELNCEINVFCTPDDHRAFRAWLRQRFGTVERLNEAIGGRFWSQSYSDWDEVYLERPVPARHGNPHMALLEKAFISDSAIRFARMQADILRPRIGERFITTNGMFGHLENDRLTGEVLDFFSYDNYPNFAYGQSGINGGGGDDLLDRASSLNLSRVRALSPNFAVMEQQSGAGGWDHCMLAPMPLPGQLRLWTMQAVAHGADYVSYFRWRTSVMGTEIYWHGILDYDARDNRRLREVTEVGRAFEQLHDVAGSRYVARIALISDWLNEWDGERDLWHGPMDEASRRAVFAAAQHAHAPMDVVVLNDDVTAQTLSRYAMMFYPHPTILSERTAQLLKAYCQGGGMLVMGARTGYKDEYGRCRMMPMPGYAAGVTGAQVEEYSLPRPEERMTLRYAGQTMPAPCFHEALTALDGAEEAACFEGGWLESRCAMTRKRYDGGGMAVYVGCGLSEELAAALIREAGQAEPWAQVVACPKEVELAVRAKDRRKWIFLLNYTRIEQTAELRRRMRNAESGGMLSGTVTLKPLEALILEMEED